jgi:acyl-CoA dehydrogenase
MSDGTILTMFERLLRDIASPDQIRAMEAAGSVDPFWTALEHSGFLDLLLPENAGGAGLSLAGAGPLIQLLGYFAAPGPVAETMVARLILQQRESEIPRGPIVLVSPARQSHKLVARMTFGIVARHALIDLEGRLILTSLAAGDGMTIEREEGCAVTVTWSSDPVGSVVPGEACDLRAYTAMLRAADISGSAARVLDMTIAYAGERVQFGKPIGRQQAIQQYLAEMAEQVVAARMAAQIGLYGHRLADAAIAKYVSSKAASLLADSAHAIFGAVGMSKEHDLQLYTRRLREMRLANGSETFWARHLGEIVLASPLPSLIELVS